MAKQSVSEFRMNVRTYGTWPVGSWSQVAPARIAAMRVTPQYGAGHPSGAVPAEFEIVYEMQGDPTDGGFRHSLILDTDQAYRLLSMLTPALATLGSSGPSLPADEQVTVGERVRMPGYRPDDPT